jgi:uridine kinase
MIEQLIGKKLIAIEGEPAAGKTTLAKILQKELNANVISIDDFYLPIEKRNESTFKEGGNNIDYDRIIDEVIQKHLNNQPIEYRSYDCRLNQYMDVIRLESKPTLIIEGSYSLGKQLLQFYDFKILLEIDSVTQLNRLRDRKNFQDFIDKWIPLSKRFIKKNNITQLVDFIQKYI